jgi:hypothetical protein
MTKKILVSSLRGIHNAVLIFVIFGWALPFDSIRLFHLIFLPLMILQWWINQGTCYLTNIENWILGKKIAKSDQDSQFIRSLISKITHKQPTRKQMGLIIYGVVVLSWSLSALFYFNSKL